MTMRGKAIVLLALQLLTVTLAAAEPSREDGDSVERLEGKLVRAVDELNAEDTIDVYGDVVTLEKIAEGAQGSLEESADPLVSRIEKFLRTRKIQINLPDDSSTAGLFGRALGQRSIGIELRSLTRGSSEARGRLKKLILPLLLVLKFKALVILPVVIGAIAMIGITGLQGALLSLLISGAVVIKALATPPPPPRLSYNVVKPHEIHHDHWHRSEEEVNQPYRAWAPKYSDEQYPYQYPDIP